MFELISSNRFRSRLLSYVPFTGDAGRSGLYKGVRWPNDSKFCLAISFDIDYVEDEKALALVVGILAEHGVQASFACIGAMVKEHVGCYKMLPDMGHEIINHSLNHPYHRIMTPKDRWNTLSEQRLREEIADSHKLIHMELGWTCKGFRTPHFEGRPETAPILKEMEYLYDSSGAYSEKEPCGSLPFLADGILQVPIYRDSSSYRCVREKKMSDTEWWDGLDRILAYERSIGGIAAFYFDPQDFNDRPWVLHKLLSEAADRKAWATTFLKAATHLAAL